MTQRAGPLSASPPASWREASLPAAAPTRLVEAGARRAHLPRGCRLGTGAVRHRHRTSRLPGVTVMMTEILMSANLRSLGALIHQRALLRPRRLPAMMTTTVFLTAGRAAGRPTTIAGSSPRELPRPTSSTSKRSQTLGHSRSGVEGFTSTLSPRAAEVTGVLPGCALLTSARPRRRCSRSSTPPGSPLTPGWRSL